MIITTTRRICSRSHLFRASFSGSWDFLINKNYTQTFARSYSVSSSFSSCYKSFGSFKKYRQISTSSSFVRVQDMLQKLQKELKLAGKNPTEAKILITRSLEPVIPHSQDIFLNLDRVLISSELKRLNGYLQRRCQGEPLAYIIGVKEFWSMEFQVNRHTLIPRSDSEILIEALVNRYRDEDKKNLPLRILDVGTGSGCLLLGALSEFPKAFGIGLDISPEALQVAKQNAHTHHLSERCEFIQQDLHELTKVSSTSLLTDGGRDLFDVILCNPPYIPHHETHLIAPDVLEYEPHLALFSSSSHTEKKSEKDLGLEMYEAMVKAMPFLLTKNTDRKTTVLLEIGSNKQALAVKELFHPKTLNFICFLKDLTQKTRGVVFTR